MFLPGGLHDGRMVCSRHSLFNASIPIGQVYRGVGYNLCHANGLSFYGFYGERVLPREGDEVGSWAWEGAGRLAWITNGARDTALAALLPASSSSTLWIGGKQDPQTGAVSEHYVMGSVTASPCLHLQASDVNWLENDQATSVRNTLGPSAGVSFTSGGSYTYISRSDVRTNLAIFSDCSWLATGEMEGCLLL